MSKQRIKRSSRIEPIRITQALLKKWPLPKPEAGSDKDGRGSVLVIAGTEGMPGAAILTATAALRAGAGKLQIAAVECIAPWIALSIPESMVTALAEKSKGVVSAKSGKTLREDAESADAVVIGPGMRDGEAVGDFIDALLPALLNSVLILDAEALKCLRNDKSKVLAADSLRNRVIVTPHAGEMAGLMGITKEEVLKDPLKVARTCAAEKGLVVVMKGRETYLCAPDGRAYVNRIGNVGLATSGSGDTLSGIIAGLASRGAEPLQAAVWGVYLHAAAGDRLAKRMGKLGFLARELLDEIPPIMNRIP